jgi:tryptophanyl-tRNA synthetase
MRRISADRAYVDSVLADGGARAGEQAEATLRSVKRIIGMIGS